MNQFNDTFQRDSRLGMSSLRGKKLFDKTKSLISIPPVLLVLMTALGVLPAQRFGINLCCRDAGQHYWLAVGKLSDQ